MFNQSCLIKQSIKHCDTIEHPKTINSVYYAIDNQLLLSNWTTQSPAELSDLSLVSDISPKARLITKFKSRFKILCFKWISNFLLHHSYDKNAPLFNSHHNEICDFTWWVTLILLRADFMRNAAKNYAWFRLKTHRFASWRKVTKTHFVSSSKGFTKRKCYSRTGNRWRKYTQSNFRLNNCVQIKNSVHFFVVAECDSVMLACYPKTRNSAILEQAEELND